MAEKLRLNGIDVSKWNNINTVKNNSDKISFIILRAGYTDMTDGNMHIDEKFEDFYKMTWEKHLAAGAYYYSRAKTVNDAVKEAEFLCSILEGNRFEFPIYMDYEEIDIFNEIGVKTATDCVIAFCSTLEKNGYYAGLYTSESHVKYYLDYDKIKRFTLWLANWTTEPKIECDIWQHSVCDAFGTGENYDCDISYKHFPSIMLECNLNNMDKTYVEVTFYTVKQGDTLSSIARKYNMNVSELYAINKETIGSNPNIIFPNMKLKVR